MGLEHVETIVADDQSTVDFTEVFDESANRYLVFVDNLMHDRGVNSKEVRLRMSSDGGSTWDSGESDYAYSIHGVESDGSTGTSAGSGNSYVRLSRLYPESDIENNDNWFRAFTVHDPFDNNRATVGRTKGVIYRNNHGTPLHAEFGGFQRLSQSGVDSIRFYLEDSANFTGGIFSVYKVTQQRGSAKQHIQTIEADNQSTVDFTEVFDQNDGFDRYQIYCDNIIPVSRGESLQSRVSSDGGGVWDSGSSDYAWSMFYSADTGDTSTSGSSEDSKMGEILHALGSEPSNNDTSQSKITVSNPTNQNRATVLRTSFSRYDNESGRSYLSGYSGGIRLTQSAIDSIQFFMETDDIASGTFSVYGIGR